MPKKGINQTHVRPNFDRELSIKQIDAAMGMSGEDIDIEIARLEKKAEGLRGSITVDELIRLRALSLVRIRRKIATPKRPSGKKGKRGSR